MEEPFAENQKHQRTPKPVCNVNTNTVKNASVTLMMWTRNETWRLNIIEIASLTLLAGPSLIYKECKAWFNSWKWSNLAWNSSGSLTIYFSVLPLSDRQMPLREKHSDVDEMTECFW